MTTAPRTHGVKVKICGVTSPGEALLAADLGADFVGLNFHPPSPRYLEPERAAEIAGAVRGRVKTVGVFVNRGAAEVEEIGRRVGLDFYQFHGDEEPEAVAPFADRAIRALRVESEADPALLDGWEAVWGLLFDARDPRAYGGSGRGWNYGSLGRLRGAASSRPVFLAGGLAPANVRAAIAAARPWAVDVCSGVEAVPGRKDPALMERFFKEIHDG